MGEVIDSTGIQFRLLNLPRPAVWSPRAADRNSAAPDAPGARSEQSPDQTSRVVNLVVGDSERRGGCAERGSAGGHQAEAVIVSPGAF
jgi:tRNA U34 5-carboxymethylaminomethyl modifying enzyme MnmG/GidA